MSTGGTSNGERQINLSFVAPCMSRNANGLDFNQIHLVSPVRSSLVFKLCSTSESSFYFCVNYIVLGDISRIIKYKYEIVLSETPQIGAIARSSFFQLHLIQKLSSLLDSAYLVFLAGASVTYRLDYCNVLYLGLLGRQPRNLN